MGISLRLILCLIALLCVGAGSISPPPSRSTASDWLAAHISQVILPSFDVYAQRGITIGVAVQLSPSPVDHFDEPVCGASACFYGASWSPDHRFVIAAIHDDSGHFWPEELFEIREDDGSSWLVLPPSDIAPPRRTCRAGLLRLRWSNEGNLTITRHYSCGLSDVVWDRTSDEIAALSSFTAQGSQVSESTASTIVKLADRRREVSAGPTSIALLPGGKALYVISDAMLKRVGPEGSVSRVKIAFPSPAPSFAPDAELVSADSIAYSGLGEVFYIADAGYMPGPGPKIVKIDVRSNPATLHMISGGLEVHGGVGGIASVPGGHGAYLTITARNQVFAFIPGRSIAGDCDVNAVPECPGGTSDGIGREARFNGPQGLAEDAATGSVYVADTYNDEIRRIDKGGRVTTLAGTCGRLTPYPDCAPGLRDGSGRNARFYLPRDIVFNPADDALYVADTFNDAIRRITKDGVVSTIAGGLAPGFVDGAGANARFDLPVALTVDPADGTLFVADKNNLAIRRVTMSGSVTTIARNVVDSAHPRAIAADDAGDLFVAEGVIAKFRAGWTSLANPSQIFGAGVTPLEYPTAVAVDRMQNVYVGDEGTSAVSEYSTDGKLDDPPRRRIAGNLTHIHNPDALAVDARAYVYVAADDSVLVFSPDADGNVAPIRTIGGPHTGIHGVVGLALDGTGRLYVSDNQGYPNLSDVLVFPPGSSGDVPPERRISGTHPGAIAVDSTGNIYVCDTSQHTVIVFGAKASGGARPIRTISAEATDDSGPTGIAIGGSGSIAVLDMVWGKVTRYHIDR